MPASRSLLNTREAVFSRFVGITKKAGSQVFIISCNEARLRDPDWWPIEGTSEQVTSLRMASSNFTLLSDSERSRLLRVSASLIVYDRRIQLNHGVVIRDAYASIRSRSPVRLFHVRILNVHCVIALWYILKMIEAIFAGAKSRDFLKLGTSTNHPIQTDCNLIRGRGSRRAGMNLLNAPADGSGIGSLVNSENREQD